MFETLLSFWEGSHLAKTTQLYGTRRTQSRKKKKKSLLLYSLQCHISGYEFIFRLRVKREMYTYLLVLRL